MGRPISLKCPMCNRAYKDPMATGVTCEFCGYSPLPSRAYPRGSSFHPDTPPATGKPILTALQRRPT